MQNQVSIESIRNEIDQINELIVKGLKKRTTLALNLKSFNQTADTEIEREIIDLYLKILFKICTNKEDESTYNESEKIDYENILLFNKRIIQLGEQVAEYKLQENPKLLTFIDSKEILKQLIVPKREEQILENIAKLAKNHEFENVESMKEIIHKIIKLTTKVELQKILSSKK